MADRVPCLVPGCRRSVPRGHTTDTEGICQLHWQLLPVAPRRMYRRRRRQYFAAWDAADTDLSRLALVTSRLWRWLRRHAIEGAMGI